MMGNKHNSTTIPKGVQEIPITAHIFEGRLYLKEKNKWTWRLFRFDGSTLTCLSSKRYKLPPNTLVDFSSQSMAEKRPISFLTSSSTMNSLTSPLLATPKNKSTVRLSSSSAIMNDINSSQLQKQQNNNEQPLVASYYQLPKWTIDMMNISSISILKKPVATVNNNNNNKNHKIRNTFNSLTAAANNNNNNNKSKTFSIRTYDGGLYIMKAQKKHDLERWIFVLAKMWKFTQAARDLYPPLPPPSPPPPLHSTQQQQQQLHVVSPTLSLQHNLNIMSFGGLENNSTDKDHMVSHQYYQRQQQQQQIMGDKRSIVYEIQQQQQNSINTAPLLPQSPICLSDTKVLWIEKWIKSLAELDACADDLSSVLDYQSAYKSIDCVYESSSILNGSTISSKRRPNIRRRPSMSKVSVVSSNHKKKAKNNTTETAATNFNMDFFQDVNTIYTGTDDDGGGVREVVSYSGNNKRKSSTVHPQQSLKYHSSTRQQKIKLVVQNRISPPLPIQPQVSITDPHLPPVIINDPFIHHYSPLEKLKERISSSQYPLSSHLQQQEDEETKSITASDENVCLADVQKNLQKMDINNKVRPTFFRNSTLSAAAITTAKDDGKINRNSWTPDVSTTLFFT